LHSIGRDATMGKPTCGPARDGWGKDISMTKRVTLLIAATLTGLCILAPTALAQTWSASPQVQHPSHAAPMIRVGSTLPGLGPLARATTQSSNWAGYDATGGGFTSVSATWTQPAVTPDPTQDSYSAFWVGLDGAGSNPVEQCGTDADNGHGTPSYYAWYEMYPAASVVISSMTITPGDVMHGSVVTDGAGDFTLTLSDETTGVTKIVQKTNAGAQGASAEVIAEAPSGAQSILPLADFGSVSFSDCAINGAPLAEAAWQQIDMVDHSTGTTLATASALGTDGASFSVTNDVASPAKADLTLSLSGLSGGVLRLGERVTMHVRLLPSDLAGSRVTFTLQRRHNGRWHDVLTRRRTTAADGRSSTTFTPSRRGTYRAQATIAKSVANTAAASRRLQFVVK
jgi:Peptidase A4 family